MRFRGRSVFISVLCGVVVLFNSAIYCQVRGPWQIEVVETSQDKQAGSFSSLVIDRFGNFHLAYSNRAGTTLRYAFRSKTDKRWDKATIDTLGGSFETLAVDFHGWAHIAYNSPKLPGLHYAHWDGKQWQKFIVDAVKTNHQTSIQLDSQGYPRISYYCEEYTGRDRAKSLKYAYFDGKTWYVQTVDHRTGTGSWNSLALGQDDRPRISYSMATGFLAFAYMDQSQWQHSLVDLPDFKGKTLVDSPDSKGKRYMDSDSSLAIAADGEPHVAYINVTTRTINYAWREGAIWHQEVVDSLMSPGGDASHVSLKLDRSGRPHVVYYDSGRGVLRYATQDHEKDKSDSPPWHIETIDDGDAGRYASLCADDRDQLYVSYYSADGELRIAHRQFVDPVQN